MDHQAKARIAVVEQLLKVTWWAYIERATKIKYIAREEKNNFNELYFLYGNLLLKFYWGIQLRESDKQWKRNILGF